MQPQTYTPSTLAQAIADGCDAVQLKYRGLWCRIVVGGGIISVYAPDDSPLTTLDAPKDDVFCVLVGDYFGPPRHELSRIVVWDCWRIGERNEESVRPEYTSIEDYTYRNRWAFVKHFVSQIGLPLVAAPVYPIEKAGELWDGQDLKECGGLVYRRTKDGVNTTLRVARKYAEAPGALP